MIKKLVKQFINLLEILKSLDRWDDKIGDSWKEILSSERKCV